MVARRVTSTNYSKFNTIWLVLFCACLVSASATDARHQLHWLPIKQRIAYKIATVTFRVRQTGQWTTVILTMKLRSIVQLAVECFDNGIKLSIDSLCTMFLELLADVNLRSRSLYCYRPSVCRLSVTLVHPTQAVKLFGNFFFTIR